MLSTFRPDLPDDNLRRRGTLKWAVAADGELPAWVAETDFGHCPAVVEAVQAVVSRGGLGYPPPDDATGLPQATAAFLGRRFGWSVEPADIRLCGDVMSGVQLALTALAEDAPVVVPTPTYPPLLDVVPLTGRKIVPVAARVDGRRYALDLHRIEEALREGARTVLVANPHNPVGRAYSRSELEALRDVVLRHGARVVVDEIHAPLVLPGATHVPYASLPDTREHTTTGLSSSKAWNLAAFTEGDGWLEELVAHLDRVRATFLAEVAERLPRAGVLPLEAGYLAWLDLRDYGGDDPAAVCRREGRLVVNDGRSFGPGGEGHVRVNLGTSLDRTHEIVRRLELAFEKG